LYDNREAHNYTTAGGDVTLPMKGAMHVLRIDFAKLNTLINTPALWAKPYGQPGYVYYPPDRYTGVVYVQFPLAPINKARFPAGPDVIPFGTGPDDSDQIRPAQGPDITAVPKTPGYALVVCNATNVPQLTGAIDPPDGFTIATNGPAYIWGNFNADGNQATGSSTLPDNANERPALIAADALTVLSADNGAATFNFQTMRSTTGSANNFTEISAAVIAGLVPTQKGTDQIWSGGVHNLVRFLENWGNYRYRGSIAVLFESEVAKSAYHEGHNPFYGAPTRDMGYHQYLSQGRFPPGTPIRRTVRRMSLEDISAATYNAGPTTPPPFN
jgi:hypothetical protein